MGDFEICVQERMNLQACVDKRKEAGAPRLVN